MTIRQPDWVEIDAVLAEANDLHARGELTYEKWRDLVLRIDRACVGCITQSDIIFHLAKPGWVDRFGAEYPTPYDQDPTETGHDR